MKLLLSPSPTGNTISETSRNNTDNVINKVNGEAKQTQYNVPKKDRRSFCVAGEIERWEAMLPSRVEGMAYMLSGRVRWSLACGVGLLEVSSGWVVGDNRMPSLGVGKGRVIKQSDRIMHRDTWGEL